MMDQQPEDLWLFGYGYFRPFHRMQTLADTHGPYLTNGQFADMETATALWYARFKQHIEDERLRYDCQISECPAISRATFDAFGRYRLDDGKQCS